MEKDMLSLMTINEGTKSFVKKIYRLSLILVIIDGLYCIINFYGLYVYLIRMRSDEIDLTNRIFRFVVSPIIGFSVLLVSVLAYILNYRAYRWILTAMESHESLLLNKGFKNIFIAFLMTAFAGAAALCSTVYENLLL